MNKNNPRTDRMNTNKHIAITVMFAVVMVSCPIHATVVNITSGSTSGYTMTDGNTYVVRNSVTFSNSTAGGNGMAVADNATVVLYVPEGITLTATGANGSGQTGGGAGILVPQTATLVITGRGTVKATGGNAGNGGKGSDGETGKLTPYSVNGQYMEPTRGNSGKGGSGGRGGGGSGAGIGGSGGQGGNSGDGGASVSSVGNGNTGNDGSTGSASTTMGIVYVLGNLTVNANSGNSGVSGTAGNHAKQTEFDYVGKNNQSKYWHFACGGGAGGGGGAGLAASCSIGAGGSSGGGGGGGGSGVLFSSYGSIPAAWPISNLDATNGTYNIYGGGGQGGSSGASEGHAGENRKSKKVVVSANEVNGMIQQTTKTYSGGSGGSGGSAGAEGGAGTLYSSQTANINANRTKLSAETHAAAQYTITFNVNGGTFSSSVQSLTATLGCPLPDCIPAPTKAGHVFRGWWTGAGGTVFYSADGTKRLNSYDRTANTPLYAIWEKNPVLTVASPFANCDPTPGTYERPSNTVIQASASELPPQERTQIICFGWVGTGSVPAAGNTTNVTFTLKNDSTLTWFWQTNVLISCSASGDGQISNGNGWFKKDGESAVFSFIPDTTYFSASLSGDTDGVLLDRIANTVSIPTDRPRDIQLAIASLDLSVVVSSPTTTIAWKTFGASGEWSIEPCADATDEYALRNGIIDIGETAVVEATVSGAGRLDFDWKISANRGDYARIYVDGTERARITRSANWANCEIDIDGTGTHTILWTYERNSATPAGEDAAFVDNVRWRPLVPLSVSASVGSPTPAVGMTNCLYGDVVAASIAMPGENNGTRFFCTGWTGTGNVPASGDGSSVSFVIETDSSLTWNSQTQYRIELQTEGSVESDFSEEWFNAGQTAVIPYRLLTSYAELELGGDADGVAINEIAGTLSAPATKPRSIVLRTTKTLTLAEALDGPDLVWTTDAGFEWSAQTAVTADNNDAAKSACVSGVDASGLETTVQGPGTLCWKWKLVAEDVAGLDVIVDDDFSCPFRSYEDSGDWATDSVEFADESTHTVRFEFWNVGSSAGDCAYLDEVSWTPAGGGKDRTVTTPESVPYVWLDEYQLGDGSEDGYETAALATAANGANKVWECYVAGLDPTNATSRFLAQIAVTNGTADVWWTPDLNEGGTKSERVYTIEGKTNLGDQFWGPTNESTRFFRVKVEMP